MTLIDCDETRHAGAILDILNEAIVNSTKAPPWSLAECSNERPSSMTTTRLEKWLA